MKDRYKRALDAGVSAAARAITYEDENSLEQVATGFGTDNQHANNIAINKEVALNWFYRVFYRNLGIQEDTVAQEMIKKYMPMKAIVGFDRLMIADVNDDWIFEENYEFKYQGTVYRFTLSDQVMNKTTGVWARDVDFGIRTEERIALINEFIRNSLNDFLYTRKNHESDMEYYVNIPAYDFDYKMDAVSGINVIVMAEGLPLPSLNPWKPEKLYAFALGGTEISRE